MSGPALTREFLSVSGPAGDLETLLERPRDRRPAAAAVVCHPHPQYGGTLNNKVTFTLARAAAAAGAVALRFNFRGAGHSAGSYGGGRGELEDLLAVERWLGGRWPDLPRWRLGFSFGAAIAIKASLAESCAVLVTVAPPVDRFDEYGIEGTPRAARWLFVQGAQDEVVEPESAIGWARRLRPGPEIRVLQDAGHFFHGRLGELRETVSTFLEGDGAGGRG